MDFTGIVLAGGRSSRMGQDKGLMSLGQGSFVENAVAELKSHCAQVIVVTNQPASYRHLEAQIITDIIPKQGPLSGIHAGLSTSTNSVNFVVACDMPFWNWQLVQDMLPFAPQFDVVVPRQGDYLQPLHAFYRSTCIQPIEAALLAQRRKITGFYPQVQVKYFDYANYDLDQMVKTFFNVNTKADFEAAKRLKDKGGTI